MKTPKNIRLLCGIAFLQGMVFYAPIASLYRQAAGLSIAQIALIESISYIIALAMELPWGILADRIGYRRTMIACCGFYCLSKLIFWRANGFSAFLLERFILSIALAGLSGVDQSMLYLSCRPEDSQKYFGRWEACSTAGLLFSSGTYLMCIGDHYRAAALATMLAYAGAALLSPALDEVHLPRRDGRPSPAAFLTPLRRTLTNARLLIFLLGFAIFREAAQMICVWLNQNQYLRCGMNSAGMGMAYILVSISMLLSAKSKQLTDFLGLRRFIGLALFCAAAGCAGLIFTRSAPVSVLCIAAVAAARALIDPLANTLLNRSITDANRATCLSTFALLQSCAAAGAQAIYGRAAEASLDAAFVLCALACMIAWIAFGIFRPAAPE